MSALDDDHFHDDVLLYDFSQWTLDEDALSKIEAAVYDIIENRCGAGAAEEGGWDFAALHNAVLSLVRSELRTAFRDFNAGSWLIDPTSGATLRWAGDSDPTWLPAHIKLEPSSLPPVLFGRIIRRLSEEPDHKPSEDDEPFDELEWNDAWESTFRVAKEWHSATVAGLRGLRAIREERRKRLLFDWPPPPQDDE